MVYPSSKYKGREWNNNDYTLVVADMIDSESTASTNNGFKKTTDEVSGYTIKQIEDVLEDTSSWNNWRDNIKSRYSNPTKNNLEKLFKAYE